MVTNKSKRHFCCFFPIFKCTGLGWSLHSWKLNEISRCDQNNAADSDNLPLALVFEDVPVARFLQSDGAQVGSTFQRCYCVTKACLQALCVQLPCPVTLVIDKVNSTLVSLNKSYCDRIKRALIQNKRCRPYMCEIIVWFLLLSERYSTYIARYRWIRNSHYAKRPHV